MCVVTDFGSLSAVPLDCFDGRIDVEYPQFEEERFPNGDDAVVDSPGQLLNLGQKAISSFLRILETG